MPTYLNTSPEVKFIEKSVVGANKTCILRYYLDLRDYPFMMKISDDPVPHDADGIFPIFNNVSDITNMSELYTARSRIILIIEELSDVNDGSVIETMIFTGDTDNQKKFQPIDKIVFTKFHQKDNSGINNSYWLPDKPFIHNSFEDSADYFHFKFVSVAVTKISGPMNFNLLCKLL